MTQQARQMAWESEDREVPIRFLLHDNDSKFTESFDTVFVSEQIKVINTPHRAPNANAYAERGGCGPYERDVWISRCYGMTAICVEY